MIDSTNPFPKIFNRTIGFFALCLMLLYFLGAGIARYLGSTISWPSFFLGLGWIILSISGVLVLNEYFNRQSWMIANSRTAIAEEKRQYLRTQSALFGVIAALLAGAAAITVLMISQGLLKSTLGLVVAIGFLLSLLLVSPPIRLWGSGLGEFILSFLACQIIPAVSFLLQNQELNRLVSMSTLPLTAFFFAMQIAFHFESFGVDSIRQPGTLLNRIGWQNGVRVHHVLILMGYILLGVAFWMGLAWRIVWPVLLTVLIAGFQVFLLNQIASGVKPSWRLYRISAAALFLVAAYFLTYSFWTI
jgi:1,4-dihydroxy-2-naphthoate octaprenyltransferase